VDGMRGADNVVCMVASIGRCASAGLMHVNATTVIQ
jgi:hypothetical protein